VSCNSLAHYEAWISVEFTESFLLGGVGEGRKGGEERLTKFNSCGTILKVIPLDVITSATADIMRCTSDQY
jgi:hypothetical protein